jgi:hypothetical protein
MGKNNTQKDTALLSVRAAVILLLATLVGVVAGILTYHDQGSLTAALLAAGAAWGGSIVVFQQLIGP